MSIGTLVATPIDMNTPKATSRRQQYIPLPPRTKPGASAPVSRTTQLSTVEPSPRSVLGSLARAGLTGPAGMAELASIAAAHVGGSARSLEPGARGERVEAAQRQLNRVFGGADLQVDGIFGPRTEARVRKLQADYGLPVTGRLDVVSQWLLGVVAATQRTGVELPIELPNVAGPWWRGERGPAIRMLQADLNEVLGRDELQLDGVFGPRTEAALIAFQEQAGIEPTGVYDFETWSALLSTRMGLADRHGEAPVRSDHHR